MARPVTGAPESGPDTARAPTGTYGSPTASVPNAHIGYDYDDEEYDDLYSYDYSRPTDAVATGATASHTRAEGDDESAQEPATKRPRLSGPTPDPRLGTAALVQAPGPSSMLMDRPVGGNAFVAASATPSTMSLSDVSPAAFSAQPLPAGAVAMPGMFYVMGAPPSGMMPAGMQHMQMFMMPVASGMFQPPNENFIQAHQPVAAGSTPYGLQTAPSVVTGARSSSKQPLNMATDGTVSGSLRNPSPSDAAPSRPQRSAALDTFFQNTDVPKDTRHHAAYFEKLQDKYPTRDEELDGRFVDDDPNDDAALLSKFGRIHHPPLKQSTARAYARSLELFESFLRRRNMEHLLAPDIDIEFPVLKLFAHVMADKYRTQRGQHKLAYQSIHKFFQALWEALLRLKHRHVPEETKEQLRSFIMCMKGDPNYDNPTARRELPLLDEQDAYFQIETLYNPNGYWVTPPNGIPRMNIRRIMTHVNIALSLLTGMRPGAAYKTDNTDELEQARLRDVQIKRLRQDELGWLFASVFDDSLGLKNGTMDDSLHIPSFLRGIGALDKLLLDLTLLIIMLGLRRKRFKHFETLADLWRDDHHVLQWKDEYLDEPLFVLEDGSPYSYKRIYTDFRELLECCGYNVHNLSAYGFRYHFSHVLKNNHGVADVDKAHAMGHRPGSGAHELQNIYDSTIRLDNTGLILEGKQDRALLKAMQSASASRVPDVNILKTAEPLQVPSSLLDARRRYQEMNARLRRFNIPQSQITKKMIAERNLSDECRRVCQLVLKAKVDLDREENRYKSADFAHRHTKVLSDVRVSPDGTRFAPPPDVNRAVTKAVVTTPSPPPASHAGSSTAHAEIAHTEETSVDMSAQALRLSQLLALLPVGVPLPGSRSTIARQWSGSCGQFDVTPASTPSRPSSPVLRLSSPASGDEDDMDDSELEQLLGFQDEAQDDAPLPPQFEPNSLEELKYYEAKPNQGFTFVGHVPSWASDVPLHLSRYRLISELLNMEKRTEPIRQESNLKCKECPSGKSKSYTAHQLAKHIRSAHDPDRRRTAYEETHQPVCPYCLVWVLQALADEGEIVLPDAIADAPRILVDVSPENWFGFVSDAISAGVPTTAYDPRTRAKFKQISEPQSLEHQSRLLQLTKPKRGSSNALACFDFASHMEPREAMHLLPSWYEHLGRHHVIQGGLCPLGCELPAFTDFDVLLYHLEDHGMHLQFTSGVANNFAECCEHGIASYHDAHNHAVGVHKQRYDDIRKAGDGNPHQVRESNAFLLCGWCLQHDNIPARDRFLLRERSGSLRAHILDQHLPDSYRSLGSNNKPKKSGSKKTTSAEDEPVDCFCGERYAGKAMIHHLMLAHDYSFVGLKVRDGVVMSKGEK